MLVALTKIKKPNTFQFNLQQSYNKTTLTQLSVFYKHFTKEWKHKLVSKNEAKKKQLYDCIVCRCPGVGTGTVKERAQAPTRETRREKGKKKKEELKNA